MRKPAFSDEKNKGADQLHSYCAADQHICFRHIAWGGKSLHKWSRSYDQDGFYAHIWYKPFKIFFSRAKSTMISKLGMQHWGLKLYKLALNDDPRLILTYLTAMSNLVANALEWWKLLQSHNLTPGGCLLLPWGYMYI